MWLLQRVSHLLQRQHLQQTCWLTFLFYNDYSWGSLHFTAVLCVAGRSYSVFSQRMLNQCLESLVQKIQSGVVINFEKTGPDPPPLEGKRHICLIPPSKCTANVWFGDAALPHSVFSHALWALSLPFIWKQQLDFYLFKCCLKLPAQFNVHPESRRAAQRAFYARLLF